MLDGEYNNILCHICVEDVKINLKKLIVALSHCNPGYSLAAKLKFVSLHARMTREFIADIFRTRGSLFVVLLGLFK